MGLNGEVHVLIALALWDELPGMLDKGVGDKENPLLEIDITKNSCKVILKECLLNYMFSVFQFK
jgi:hypothetical protein